MFKEIHYYKPNLEEVVQRFKSMYAAKGPGYVAVYALAPAPGGEPVPPLNSIDFDRHMEDYLDLCLRNYSLSLEYNRDVLDDLIPTFGPNFGIGEYSAFIKGDVVFTEDTSWAAPVLENLADFKDLTLMEDAYWVRMMERAMRHLVRQTSDGPIPIIRGYYSPLDLAHALRGEKLFTDFMDSPDLVHAFLDFCADAIIWLAKRLRSITGLYFGGNIAGAWLMPGTICMSEDIACLVSPRTYAEFARPCTQKVIDAFGYGQIHTHSLGVRTIPEITRLDHLLGVQISDDPNVPRGFEKLDFLLPRCNGIPLTVGCTPDELRSSYARITAAYNITYAATVDDAAEGRDLVSWVRGMETHG
ncbi:uroporphyrinogen-III decarboxylase [Longilinea arvoryzae]|uniref:Uroporphyrinogen-III decarboxylase n=1 Tax=Longilinea arvoryzae TaxID=360412 RepID=A0A0S7BIB8_9CHLR|nr:uroporphyrinogen decarboxylase family protein [Longilinea arvoryzae]GAP13627.1 uroporphyrinogen-III decarboxylase [Longilinea arvoryzae]